MLTHLRISQLGVIDESVFEPSPGMTAVTGETGAGKTMVVTGLGLLLGNRADSSMVRIGGAKAIVEGRFDHADNLSEHLDQWGGELDGDELLVARQIMASGRSRALAGGVQVPVARLSELTDSLATIHGQSEQIKLGESMRQRALLDQAGGDELVDLVNSYHARWIEYQHLIAQRDELVSSTHERAQRLDMLDYGIDEIASIDPHLGEDDELTAALHRLQAADELREYAAVINTCLNGTHDDNPGALAMVGIAAKAAEKLCAIDAQASTLAQRLIALTDEVNELARECAYYLDQIDADPAAMEQVTARRAELARLTRKYGSTIAEVLAWQDDARSEREQLAVCDSSIDELSEQIDRLSATLEADAELISQRRAEVAQRLAEQVHAELASLAMPHAQVRFELADLEKPGPWGKETISLLLSANPGSPLAPLAKVASGGELSRVRLALEVVMAQSHRGHLFIFDEVDAGIGGSVALEVGRRLARLAKSSQVIVVTHLAQVAAYADAHWLVEKSDDGVVTTSQVRKLNPDEQAVELARMMSGAADSDSAKTHARELLAQATAERRSDRAG